MKINSIKRSTTTSKNASVTLAEAMETFIQRKVDEFDITTSTAKRYRITAKFFEGLADRPIDELIPDEIRMYIRSKAPFSKHEVRAAVNLLRGTFRLAVELDWVTKDVTYNIQPREFFKLCYPRVEKVSLSNTAIMRIKKDAREQTPNMRAFAILLSIETGMRAGEVVALKWEDVGDDFIHIHRQQRQVLDEMGHSVGFEELPYTQGKGACPRYGRHFPITPEIKALLDEIRAYTGNGEYVLAENDNWITKTSYESYLRRHMKRLGYKTANNQTFRVALNSNVLIPNGIDAVGRAELLGTSIGTNVRYYPL